MALDIYVYLKNNSAIHLLNSYIDDSPSILYWSNGYFLKKDDTNYIWIADPIDHTIKLVSKGMMNFFKF